MADYFLSYAGEDRPIASALTQGLSASGIALWCDLLPGALPAGRSWVQGLEAALQDCRAYLILVGQRGVNRWVRAELDYALNRQALQEDFRIVPLLLEGIDPASLSPFLGRFQAIPLAGDATRWGGEEFARLATRIREAEPGGLETGVAVCPFPGLECFDESLARFLFGRDTEIGDGVARLGRTASGYRRWLQIEGPSGSGKSSLARAGIVPAVRRGWVEEAPKAWQVAVLRPGRAPLANLATALFHAFESPGSPGAEAPPRHPVLAAPPPVTEVHAVEEAKLNLDRIEPRLQASDNGLRNLLRECLATETGFLLVVDQLEEALTLAGEDTTAIRRFDALLTTALEDADLPFLLLTTIRSDFMGRFRDLPGLEARLNDRASRYYLKPLEETGLRAAVEGPAKLAGLVWESGLPERIVADAVAAKGALPLLGHVLRALWDRRSGNRLTNEAYQTLGGVSGALARGADALLNSFTAAERQAVQRLLLNLVHIGRGAPDSARVVTRAEALSAAGPEREAELLLTRLSGGRAPDTPRDAPAPPRLVVVGEEDRVELAHEALIRHWTTLGQWVDDDRKALERRDDLEAAALAWDAAGRSDDGLPHGAQLAYYAEAHSTPPVAQDFLARAHVLERRRLRRRRLSVLGLTVIAVAMAGLALFAFRESQRADAQRRLAEQRLQDAVEVTDRIVFLLERKLQPVAGAAGVRRELLESADQLLDKLEVGGKENVDFLYSRRVSHISRGDLALTHDDLDLAMEEYQAAFQIMEQLAQNNPSNTHWQRELSVSYNKVGDVLVARGDLDGALQAFQNDLKISERLAPSDPSNVTWQLDLVVSFYKLGSNMDLSSEDGRQEAMTRFSQALEILYRLDAEGRLAPNRKGWIEALETALEQLDGESGQ